MASRSHFAAPLLLAVFLALILYVSLYPFGFDADGPPVLETLRMLTWARASRSDMFNNVLLYAPLGFCLALVLEPRLGRIGGIVATVLLGAMLSLSMEILQASIAPRVPSLTDLSLNALGAALGATAGSAWYLLGARMAPQASPQGRSAAVAVTIVVLWLLARLWPLMPDASLRQLKRAVRPLFSPSIGWAEFAAYFVGWLVVAQAVFHLARRQRGVDAFLLVIAAVLVGRTFTAGHTLEFTELAAIALLLPVLVLVNRIEDRGRSALLAAVLSTWLAAVALWPAIVGGAQLTVGMPGLAHFSINNAPPPAELAGKGFRYVALAWLLVGAGLFAHVAAGLTVLLVLVLCMLQVGAAAPTFGWIDLVIAMIAGLMVWRWR
ncbi:MAG: VanZ family protein [Steroidobacteraceae bacterium]